MSVCRVMHHIFVAHIFPLILPSLLLISFPSFNLILLCVCLSSPFHQNPFSPLFQYGGTYATPSMVQTPISDCYQSPLDRLSACSLYISYKKYFAKHIKFYFFYIKTYKACIIFFIYYTYFYIIDGYLTYRIIHEISKLSFTK